MNFLVNLPSIFTVCSCNKTSVFSWPEDLGPCDWPVPGAGRLYHVFVTPGVSRPEGSAARVQGPPLAPRRTRDQRHLNLSRHFTLSIYFYATVQQHTQHCCGICIQVCDSSQMLVAGMLRPQCIVGRTWLSSNGVYTHEQLHFWKEVAGA